jgi:outer membrane protein insertion porin family
VITTQRLNLLSLARCIAFGVIHCAPLFVALAAPARPADESRYEIRSVEIEGNDRVGKGDLMGNLETKPTPGFFNKFLFRMGGWLGRKNEYFDFETFDRDVERLHQYYRDRGFFDARIDTSLQFSPGDRLVDIMIRVQEGYRSIIDSLTFKGIARVPEFVYEDMQSGQKIQKGDAYDRLLLDEEVVRVRMILWNAGYPNALYTKDSSSAVYRTSTRNVSVVIAYNLGKRYLFGDVTIHNELDSLRGDISDGIVLQQLDYAPGDFYSEINRRNSERNLNRIGIFDQAHIGVRVPANEDTSILVSSQITVRPKNKHELAPEALVSDENSAFNLGAGIGYTNRNFLGGARTASTRVRFRTQTIDQLSNPFKVNSSAVSNVELSFEVLQPYIFTNKIKGSWTLSLIRDKQVPYRQDIIRNRFGFTDRFAEFTTGFLDWTLERVNLKRNETFQPDPNDPASQAQINNLIEQQKKTQFNSILSFTIQRDRSNDLFSPSEGFIHSATIEESGLLPLLLEKAQPDLPFTQFYRVILLGRWYRDVSTHRFSILAVKLKAGFEEKYGKSRSDSTRDIPNQHRFYGGGGGGIRGWASRDLSASGDPQFGGNLALEGSVELRMNVFQSLHDGYLDKMWLVGFLDFGNVWGEVGDFQFEEIAIATGLGFRYDTFFGPLRIDFGFRVFNPAAAPGAQWITQRRFFGDTLRDGVLHFGIGHAF